VETVQIGTARNKLAVLVDRVCQPYEEPIIIASGDLRAVLISADDLSRMRAGLTTLTAQVRTCEQNLEAAQYDIRSRPPGLA
jgi:PHD/YefM family antitoxin component YafN of YafNO toxin-antitoxin module